MPPSVPNRTRVDRDGPVRSCIGCRRRFAKEELVRLVADDDRVVIDTGGAMPGRGGYLCDEERCVDRALASEGRLVRRALRVGPRGATVDATALRQAWQAARRPRR